MNNPHVLIQAVSNGFIVTLFKSQPQSQFTGFAAELKKVQGDPMLQPEENENSFQKDENVSIHSSWESVLAHLAKLDF